MRIQANAKINWTLNVLSRRVDGYHTLDMLMQSVSLCDTLELTPAKGIAGYDEQARPLERDNLALRAARGYFSRAGLREGVHIRLTKRIPACAGLGGGSADAAGVLLALERMFAPLQPQVRQELALSLGADVPFCLQGGLARVSGIGETLQALSPPPVFTLLLVMPPVGISTAELFSRLRLPCVRTDQTQAQDALLLGDVIALAPYLQNALEPDAIAMLPEIADAKAWLLNHGALAACMTGSGSCVFGLYATPAAAAYAWQRTPQKWFSAVCTTAAQGVAFMDE